MSGVYEHTRDAGWCTCSHPSAPHSTADFFWRVCKAGKAAAVVKIMLRQPTVAMHVGRKAGTNRHWSSCCAPSYCTEAMQCVHGSCAGLTTTAGGQDIALSLQVIECLTR